jgi:exopolyphosphatase/guanosine-5'-triphosphate,3'-diphosphate pyrophosphatase
VQPGALRLTLRDRVAQLSWADGWERDHPRTLHLLRQEVDAWQKSAPFVVELPVM